MDSHRSLAIRQLNGLVLLLTLAVMSFFAFFRAQEGRSPTTKKPSSGHTELDIIPLITLEPGEKRLLFSRRCTVGLTRCGGFSVAEMRDGKPHFERSTREGNRSLSTLGVPIMALDFEEGIGFASAPECAPLEALGIHAFTITLTASSEAQPGIVDMHLADTTCCGHCGANVRVLVPAL